jgi:hypothetical protein
VNHIGTRSSPTTVAGARDLSAYPASTSATTESDLIVGFGLVPFVKTFPCACGGWVTGDIECPAAGLRLHQATREHAVWRQRHAL